MNQVALNQSIPGWNQLDIQLYLAELVSKLPNNSNILEIGAFFGRTTYVLGHNKPKDAKLFVIDPWMTYYMDHFKNIRLYDTNIGKDEEILVNSYIKESPKRIEGDDFFLLWKHFVGEIENLIPIREYSPVKNREWPLFNFIYHDASHEEENIYEDLVFWFPLLINGGMLIMDDYHKKQFPGLCRSVNKYIDENNLRTSMIGSRNICIHKA